MKTYLPSPSSFLLSKWNMALQPAPNQCSDRPCFCVPAWESVSSQARTVGGQPAPAHNQERRPGCCWWLGGHLDPNTWLNREIVNVREEVFAAKKPLLLFYLPHPSYIEFWQLLTLDMDAFFSFLDEGVSYIILKGLLGSKIEVTHPGTSQSKDFIACCFLSNLQGYLIL